jgi:hypothetical protein
MPDTILRKIIVFAVATSAVTATAGGRDDDHGATNLFNRIQDTLVYSTHERALKIAQSNPQKSPQDQPSKATEPSQVKFSNKRISIFLECSFIFNTLAQIAEMNGKADEASFRRRLSLSLKELAINSGRAGEVSAEKIRVENEKTRQILMRSSGEPGSPGQVKFEACAKLIQEDQEVSAYLDQRL